MPRGRGLRFGAWSESLPSWQASRRSANDLISIEEIAAPVPRDKIKGHLPETGRFALETVLHASELEAQRHMLQAFAAYLERRGIEAEFGRRFFAKGLCFLEIDALVERADDIVAFTAVRALRQMPDLRVLRPIVRSQSIPTTALQLPQEPPLSK